jgi:hypothetical protein
MPTVAELRVLCKQRNLTGYHALRKAELEQLLAGNESVPVAASSSNGRVTRSSSRKHVDQEQEFEQAQPPTKRPRPAARPASPKPKPKPTPVSPKPKPAPAARPASPKPAARPGSPKPKPSAKPIHVTHDARDATAAIAHLQRLVKPYERTQLCRGLPVPEWLQDLVNTQHFHPSICPTQKFRISQPNPANPRLTLDKASVSQLSAACARESNVLLVPVSLRLWTEDRVTNKPRMWAHTNMMLVDHRKRRIELFEPHGYASHNAVLEERVRAFIRQHAAKALRLGAGYTFATPYDECPTQPGPQSSPNKTKQSEAIRPCKNQGGYCRAYSCIYAHLHLLAPDAEPRDTLDALLALGPLPNQDLVLRYVSWQEANSTQPAASDD